jgi:two-component system sensor histidine kinase MprB
MRGELRGQVDDSLRVQGAQVARTPLQRAGQRDLPGRVPQPQRRTGASLAYVQFLSRDGTVRRPPQTTEPKLPVTGAARRIAAAGRGRAIEDAHADGVPVRMLTVALPGRGAVQLARSLRSVDRALSRLRIVLAMLTVFGTAFAALLARIFSRPVAAPTEQQLALSEGALADSLAAQRQLVADASHELRTPVTSLRTNVEVLLDDEGLDDTSRAQLLDDMREQSEELSALVSDVIELARGDAQAPEPQDLRIDELAREAVLRARRHAPGDVEIALEAQPATLAGVPERLGRAINNLLDNAVRHAPPGSVVHVTAGPAGVTVRDHGAGIDAEDLPHLFDRFYRGVRVRGEQGTGLGLAIVRQVAEAHGGGVTATNAADGGAEFRLTLPGRALHGSAQHV